MGECRVLELASICFSRYSTIAKPSQLDPVMHMMMNAIRNRDHPAEAQEVLDGRKSSKPIRPHFCSIQDHGRLATLDCGRSTDSAKTGV